MNIPISRKCFALDLNYCVQYIMLIYDLISFFSNCKHS